MKFPTAASLTTMAPPGGAQPLEPISIRIDDACRVSGIGRTKLYDLMANGEIKSVKIGRSRRVLTESLKRYLYNQPSGGLKSKANG